MHPLLKKNPGSAPASLRPSKKQRQQEIQKQMFLVPAPFISGGRLSLSSPTGVLSTQIILQSRVTGVTFHKTYTHLFITLTFLKPASYLLGYLSYDASRCLKHVQNKPNLCVNHSSVFDRKTPTYPCLE